MPVVSITIAIDLLSVFSKWMVSTIFGLCKNVLDFSVVVGKFMLNRLRWQSSEQYRFLDIW